MFDFNDNWRVDGWINRILHPFSRIQERLDEIDEHVEELIDLADQQLDGQRIYHEKSLELLAELVKRLSPPKPVKMDLKFGTPQENKKET